jgi:hypothetical protein
MIKTTLSRVDTYHSIEINIGSHTQYTVGLLLKNILLQEGIKYRSERTETVF